MNNLESVKTQAIFKHAFSLLFLFLTFMLGLGGCDEVTVKHSHNLVNPQIFTGKAPDALTLGVFPLAAHQRPYGILVDGSMVFGGSVNDETHIGSHWDDPIEVGWYWGPASKDPPLPGEIIAFAFDRPPTLKPTLWKWWKETAEVTFDKTIEIPVQIYLVHAGGNSVSVVIEAIEDAVDEVNEMWRTERAGIRLKRKLDGTNPLDVTDMNWVGKNGLAGHYGCGIDKADIEAEVKTHLGCNNGVCTHPSGVQFNDDILNIYYFHKVADSGGIDYWASAGAHCGGKFDESNGTFDAEYNIIAIGSFYGGNLLAHELGHKFGLQHVGWGPSSDGIVPSDLPFFNNRNIMYAGYLDDSEFLTEGQTFRQVWHNASALNLLYKLKPKTHTRNCTQFRQGDNKDKETLFKCPYEEKRIWADGEPGEIGYFPSN